MDNITAPLAQAPLPSKSKKIIIIVSAIVVVLILMALSFWGGAVYENKKLFGSGEQTPVGIMGAITNFENNTLSVDANTAVMFLPEGSAGTQNIWQIKITPQTQIVQLLINDQTGIPSEVQAKIEDFALEQTIFAAAAGKASQEELNAKKSFDAGKIIIYPQ